MFRYLPDYSDFLSVNYNRIEYLYQLFSLILILIVPRLKKSTFRSITQIHKHKYLFEVFKNSLDMDDLCYMMLNIIRKVINIKSWNMTPEHHLLLMYSKDNHHRRLNIFIGLIWMVFKSLLSEIFARNLFIKQSQLTRTINIVLKRSEILRTMESFYGQMYSTETQC